jgi:hypothetical protein
MEINFSLFFSKRGGDLAEKTDIMLITTWLQLLVSEREISQRF